MFAECFYVTLLKFSLTLRPSVLHVLQLLCLDPECHRDKNEAQVILVSFFSAMVTVMEGVQLSPVSGPQKIRSESYNTTSL